MVTLHIKKQFSDVYKQVLHFDCVYSRREIEDKVIQFSKLFGQKAMVYVQQGKKVVIYTSQIFTDKLKNMKKGDIVADHCTGRVGVITSEEPFSAVAH